MAITDSAEWKENINMDAFQQVLEMDEDDSTHQFSKSNVVDYLHQMDQVLEEVDGNLAGSHSYHGELERRDELKNQFRLLKHTANPMGFQKVADVCRECEYIAWPEDHSEAGVFYKRVEDADAFSQIKERVTRIKSYNEVVRQLMTKFYGNLDLD